MDIKLFDSELKVMDILWDNGDVTAKKIAALLKEQIGWSKTTTYTVIKKCIDKGAIERREPNFICHSILDKDLVREAETEEFINKMYGGSADLLVASILGRKNLSVEEIEKLKKLIKTFE